jgi:succinate dehydrogenase hydrophobic anchor subunit
MRSAPAWAWAGQRITAVLVVGFLSAHLWFSHLTGVGQRITLERVAQRLGEGGFFFLYIALLAAALYHALYGLRGIALDYGPGPRARAAVTWLALFIGLAGFAYGSSTLFSFLFG